MLKIPILVKDKWEIWKDSCWSIRYYFRMFWGNAVPQLETKCETVNAITWLQWTGSKLHCIYACNRVLLFHCEVVVWKLACE